MSTIQRTAVMQNISEDARENAFRKAFWRLTPFLMISYVLAYLDRTNIGIAQLQLKTDIGMSDAAYGLGAGIFYIGYLSSELPSNLMLSKIGARRTFARIMILWGIVEVLMMFIKTPLHFYVARVALGFAEGGFFPGILLFISYWFPGARRARVTALFMQCFPLSFLVGAPLSGWIMDSFSGVSGLAGWQWMFLIEGILPILMGVVALVYLCDTPAQASWLDSDEKRILIESVQTENALKKGDKHHSWLKVLTDPRVYLVGVGSFGIYVMTSTISFWSPIIMKGAGVARISHIGFLLAIPAAVASVAMYFVGRHSDRTLERRWHAALCMVVTSVSCALLPSASTNITFSIVLLSLLMAGTYASMVTFFTIPAAYLSDTAAAGGIAMVSMLGAVGAAIGPIILGAIRTQTGNLGYGLYLSAATMLVGAITVVLGVPAHVLRERKEA